MSGARHLIPDGMPEFGTPKNPVIGGVAWNGSIFLDPPPGLSEPEELLWRLEYDLVWVMQNLITILHKDDNRQVPFRLNRPQMWAMWNLTEMLATGRPSWGWFLKGRQFGYSTLFTVILFIGALRGKNGLLLAHLESPGKSIFKKAELALKSLPTLEFENGDGARQVVQIVPPPSGTAGTIMSWLSKEHSAILRRDSAENRDAGVGETFQNVQITEAPLFPDADHTIGHLLPALSRTVNTFVNGEFTARGEGDYAHRVWLQSVTGDSLFRAVFAGWYWHTPYKAVRRDDDKPWSPEEEMFREAVKVKGHEFPLRENGCLIPRLQKVYDSTGKIAVHDLAVGVELTDEQMQFRREAIQGFAGDIKKWNSEYPATPEEAFRVAGRKLIPSEVMDVIEVDLRDPLDKNRGVGEYVSHQSHGGKGVPRWTGRRDGRVHRFELPRAGCTYIVWADPSSGAGVDPTGAGVYRIEYGKCVLVLSFEGFSRPHEVARMLARIGRHYRDDAVIDLTTKKLTGGVPCEIVVERNGFGEAVITELQNLRYRRIWRYSDRTKDNWRHGHDYGFPTYKDTKMPMLQKFAQGCYDGQIMIPCRRVTTSMRAMQYLDDDDRTAGAPRGQHDDLAMAAGIGFHAASEKKVFRIKPKEKQPAWLENRAIFPNAG